jgi:hypothetical protein
MFRMFANPWDAYEPLGRLRDVQDVLWGPIYTQTLTQTKTSPLWLALALGPWACAGFRARSGGRGGALAGSSSLSARGEGWGEGGGPGLPLSAMVRRLVIAGLAASGATCFFRSQRQARRQRRARLARFRELLFPPSGAIRSQIGLAA